MGKSIFNFVFTHRRRLVIVFTVVFAILGGISGFVSQAKLLPVPVMVFGGGLSGGLFGILTFVCLLGLLDTCC
jgi:membrane associated rhomboid family serine protease